MALGWPTWDTRIVAPEYPVKGGRVDYALCDPPEKPIAFVEVKGVGQSEGAERQLFEYAFHAGVPVVILSDGQLWHFFLPAEQGNYDERRVYKLDLMERDVEESASRLMRYLQYESVKSHQALQAAQEDYRNMSRQRLMKETLPKAWAKLVEEEEGLLLELIADEVATLCGYKPDQATVADFVRGNLCLPDTSGTKVQPRRTVATPNSAPVVLADDSRTLGGTGFVFRGNAYPARSAFHAMVQIFEEFRKIDPLYFERFAARKHGTKRRIIDREPARLFPGRPDLVRIHARKLSDGWWIGANVSRARIEQIIRMACEVAGVKFGSELIVNLGG